MLPVSYPLLLDSQPFRCDSWLFCANPLQVAAFLRYRKAKDCYAASARPHAKRFLFLPVSFVAPRCAFPLPRYAFRFHGQSLLFPFVAQDFLAIPLLLESAPLAASPFLCPCESRRFCAFLCHPLAILCVSNPFQCSAAYRQLRVTQQCCSRSGPCRCCATARGHGSGHTPGTRVLLLPGSRRAARW